VATVKLRGPLKQYAGGVSEHEAAGATVRDVLVALERAQPALAGWILDERRLVRRHINVFVNGEYGSEETAVADGDRIDVLPAISGG
jgi:molybdopterin converting factor small subunit